MDIAVIGGTGAQGSGIAIRLAAAGHRIVVGSRERARAEETVVRLHEVVPEIVEPAVAATNPDAAASADVLFVTVPFAGQAEIYRSITDSLRPGAIVLDATSPLATAIGGRPTEVLRPWHGSAAEQAAAICGDRARIVSGFHTVAASELADRERPLDGDVLLAGDDAEAKATIGGLVEQVPDLRWVDCGPLTSARLIEPMTALLVGLNRRYHRRDAGLRVTGPADGEGWGRPRA